MAEIAGLVVGGVALASLFSTCVECFDDVQLARHYGRDYEILALKFRLLELRLNLWGQTVWILDEQTGETVVNSTWKNSWPIVGEGVTAALLGISHTFEDIDKLTNKYGIEKIPQEASDKDLELQNSSASFRDLREIFGQRMLHRQKRTSVIKKTTWALQDRSKFGELVADISTFVDNLDTISAQVGIIWQQTRMFEATVNQVSQPESVSLLEATVESDEDDNALRSQTKEDRTTTHVGHEYIKAVVTDRAKQVNGDVGVINTASGRSGNVYNEPRAQDTSVQINGDMGADAFQALLNSR